MKKTITLLAFQCCFWTVLTAQPSYENTQIADVQAYMYNMSATPINGNNDETNQLRTGTVIYYKTSEGRWGKMRIQQYDANLIIEWMTFNDNGSTYSYGSNLTVRGSYTYDLDLGREGAASNDFWWQHQAYIIRNLVPNNNAQFYKVNYAKKAKKPTTQPTAQTDAPTIIGDDKSIGTDDKGRTLYQSPRGGTYYINSNGNKSYIKTGQQLATQDNSGVPTSPAMAKASYKPAKNRFMPRGNVANTDDYFNIDFASILAAENKMKDKLNLGGLEGSPIELKAGTILLYKTSKNNFGKMQILSFGKYDTISELYTRWISYDKEGKTVQSNELEEDILASSLLTEQVEDLDGSSFPGWEFAWTIKNGLLFMKTRSDAKFYLLKANEQIGSSNNTSTYGNTGNTVSSITWQHPLSNKTTTSSPSLELKACVETSETIKEYTLIQNGQRLSISRGLIPRKANDCLNAFNQTVTLKNGENTFQLIAQTAKGEIKSDVFNIIFDKNSRPAEPIATETKIEKRIALVIGNADYTEGSKLKNPVNDANLITQTLKNLGFRVMQFNNLKKTDFERAIRDFSAALADYNVALFYYAGHGVQVDGENYLLPVDAKLQDKKDVRFEAVKVRFAIEEFENHPDNVNIVILDACRNNPFRSWARGGAEGFKQMNIGGTLVAFATAPDATASDGTGSNGLYTEELAKQMLINQPLEAVFRETRRAVLSRSSRTQNPQEWSQLTQSFYFKK